ncbi:hypothetical protein F4810DRAFT_658892 [Camillea tinctor]|nr:hypothetical protein F4810DRAFT_658892 [Camillea tinctor]
MNSGICKAGSWHPRTKLSDTLKEQLLNTIAGDDGESTLKHPKPKPAHATFLKKFRDSFQPNPHFSSGDSFIYDWLESVGTDRNTRCRSDSCLSQLTSDPFPRHRARSAPQMGSTRDVDMSSIPQTPKSIRSWAGANIGGTSIVPSDASGRATGFSRAPGKSLVENSFYREMNLAANDIYMRPPYEEFPEEVADLVNYIQRDRGSPGPSADQVRQDPNLAAFQWMGAGEPQVEQYFSTHIFPYPGMTECLQRSDRQPMGRNTVPNSGSKLKVSTPVPDMLYGYSRQGAFPDQQAQLISMGTDMAANTQDLLYPFFVIEFKGDGPSGSGSMWVADNQCLGAAASCVNIAKRLNRQLEKCRSDRVHPVNSAAFSISMNGTQARLYISWKHNELKYYMANIDSFSLQKPADYITFRRYVRNILDWGKDKRLAEIRSSLDALLEAAEDKRETTEAAIESRSPPCDSSVKQAVYSYTWGGGGLMNDKRCQAP